MVARAATVTPGAGQVLINQGDGYISISGTTAVNPGDSVMVYPGGNALISYGGGCNVTVQSGSVASVSEQPPCDLAALDETLVETAAHPITADFTVVAIGVGILAGGYAIAVAAAGGDDDKRRATSP